jgi:hypothetical protein
MEILLNLPELKDSSLAKLGRNDEYALCHSEPAGGYAASAREESFMAQPVFKPA